MSCTWAGPKSGPRLAPHDLLRQDCHARGAVVSWDVAIMRLLVTSSSGRLEPPREARHPYWYRLHVGLGMDSEPPLSPAADQLDA
jgi:hypothetical protein